MFGDDSTTRTAFQLLLAIALVGTALGAGVGSAAAAPTADGFTDAGHSLDVLSDAGTLSDICAGGEPYVRVDDDGDIEYGFPC